MKDNATLILSLPIHEEISFHLSLLHFLSINICSFSAKSGISLFKFISKYFVLFDATIRSAFLISSLDCLLLMDF